MLVPGWGRADVPPGVSAEDVEIDVPPPLDATEIDTASPVSPAAQPARPAMTPPPARPAPPVVIARPQPPLKRNGIHFNPLSIAFGVFGLGYERVLHERISLQVQLEYTNMWGEDGVWGMGGGLRPFFFFFRQAPGGMYISPFARLAYAEATVGSATGSGVGWAVGATIGWSWVLGPVNIRAGGGIQYFDMEVEAHGDGVSSRVGLAAVLPAADLSIGFVF